MTDMQAAPEGFREMDPYGPFHELVGPIYITERDGREILGMRVQDKHRNKSATMMHGGMFMTLADTAMTRACLPLRREDQGVVTTACSGEFLAAAVVGDWIEAEVEVLKAGRTVIFLNCMIRKAGAGGKLLMRFGGTFQVVSRG